MHGIIIEEFFHYLPNGQAIILLWNKVVWYAVHLFVQSHEGKPKFNQSKIANCYSFERAKSLFIKFASNIRDNEEFSKDWEKSFQVKNLKKKEAVTANNFKNLF